MPFYLAPWDGTGTEDDPFHPRGVDGGDWAAVDLRPDASRGDGWCLLWSRAAVQGDGLIQLPNVNADQPDLDRELPTQRADEAADALGLDRARVRGRSTRSLIAGALTDLAEELGVNPARAERDGVRRIRMGGAGVVWDEERDG